MNHTNPPASLDIPQNGGEAINNLQNKGLIDKENFDAVIKLAQDFGYEQQLVGLYVHFLELRLQEIDLCRVIKLAQKHKQDIDPRWDSHRLHQLSQHLELLELFEIQKPQLLKTKQSMKKLLPTQAKPHLIEGFELLTELQRRLKNELIAEPSTISNSIFLAYPHNDHVWIVQLFLLSFADRDVLVIGNVIGENNTVAPAKTSLEISNALDISLSLKGEEKERSDSQFVQNLQAIHAALVKHKITDVEITFSGSGDDGDVDSVEAYYSDNTNATRALEEPVRIIGHALSWGTTYNTISHCSLVEGIKTIVYDYLEQNTPGWEVNEGSQGRIELKVLPNYQLAFSSYAEGNIPEPVLLYDGTETINF